MLLGQKKLCWQLRIWKEGDNVETTYGLLPWSVHGSVGIDDIKANNLGRPLSAAEWHGGSCSKPPER